MNRVQYSILVVDDESSQRQLLTAVLQPEYSVEAVESAEKAIRSLGERSYDVIITDQKMPGLQGTDLIRWVREQGLDTPVILLTAYGSIESAVEAVKTGAQEYLTKPLKSPEELRLVVARTLRNRSLSDRKILHESETEERFPTEVVAESSEMREVLRLAAQVAPQPSTVLLTGESGTGKEVVARFIHRRSPRKDEPFVAVNCAALAESLLESELFGHEKGSFTGATQTRKGRFEIAHGGTLFLDEIGEMSPRLQAQLLRVLQEQSFERVGGTRTIRVDVRLIAATNRNLEDEIRERNFREDLYYRLAVFPIDLPPLRERRSDITPLAHFFLQKISRRMGRPLPTLDRTAEVLLRQYDWPGNVRELQNAMERALIVAGDGPIKAGHFPLLGESTSPPPAPVQTLAALERSAILAALERNQGNRRKAADELGISLRTLQYRVKEYRIGDPED